MLWGMLKNIKVSETAHVCHLQRTLMLAKQQYRFERVDTRDFKRTLINSGILMCLFCFFKSKKFFLQLRNLHRLRLKKYVLLLISAGLDFVDA